MKKVWNIFALIATILTIPFLGYTCYQVSFNGMNPKELAVFVFIAGLYVLVEQLISNIDSMLKTNQKKEVVDQE